MCKRNIKFDINLKLRAIKNLKSVKKNRLETQELFIYSLNLVGPIKKRRN